MAQLSIGHARTSSGSMVINRGVAIVGSLTVEGQVFIEGAVDGEVWCTTLEISERGAVEGVLVAERVVVLGEFRGQIYANELVLGAGCAVEGQIYHDKLVIEDGCYFEGKSRRHGDPRQLAAAAQGRAPAREALQEQFA